MNDLLVNMSMMETYDYRLKDGHCFVNAGVGKGWLTIYLIQTEIGYENQGEATRLLERLKEYSKETHRKLRVWCPMNEIVVHLCQKLEIEIV